MKTLSEIIETDYSTKKLLWATAMTAHWDKEKMTNYEKLYESCLNSLYNGLKTLDISDKSFFEKAVESLTQLSDNYPHNIKELTKYNWFIEIDMEKHIPELLNVKLNEDNYPRINSAITNYYETNFDRIIEELCTRHPKWKFLIEKNVRVYRLGEIEHAVLFIPSLIDGICGDKLDKSFFKKKKIEKNNFELVVIDELHKAQDDFLEIYIKPILEDCPIYAQDSKIDRFPSKLNRHKIVHGKDIDYGTQENYLKCLSLFKYVSDLLFIFDDPNRYRQCYFVFEDDR